jgi:hypothetical protein
MGFNSVFKGLIGSGSYFTWWAATVTSGITSTPPRTFTSHSDNLTCNLHTLKILQFVQTVLFIVSPSMAVSAHTKQAFAGKSRDSCRAKGRHTGRARVSRQNKCNERKMCFTFILNSWPKHLFVSVNTSQVDGSRNARSSSGKVFVILAWF